MVAESIAGSLVGKAGEALVASELMRRGIQVAYPAVDVGADLLAYRLNAGQRTTRKFVPVQVKASSGVGYKFDRKWFERAPDLALVLVWHMATPTPEFYVFGSFADVEAVIAPHAGTDSWARRGVWSGPVPSKPEMTLMEAHLGAWGRIVDHLAGA